MKIFLVVVVFLGMMSFAMISGYKAGQTVKPAPTPPAISKSAMAFSACQVSHRFVLAELKAPATAKFANCLDVAPATYAAGQWQFDGYVDSQNGFGAQLRTPYRIVLEGRTSGADVDWTLISLTMP